MPTIERRAFALGFLVLPLTGCADPKITGSASPSATSFGRARDEAAVQTVFLNAGHWTDSGPPVFVVTDGINR